MSTTNHFSLVEDPWIPALALDGRACDISLRQALVDGHQYRTIATELATETTAIIRLLLAVVHAAVNGPTDLQGWAELRALDRAPAAVEQYLDHWAHRFVLTGDQPFMQTPGLRTARGTTGLALLLPERRPSRSSARAVRPISPAEAARLLVHLHAADPSGIKPGLLDDPETTLGKGMPRGQGWIARGTQHRVEGPDLWHTLALNAVPVRYPSSPVWEGPTLPAHDRHQPPAGRVALSTWPTRRVLLIRDEHTGMIVDAVIGQGDRIDVSQMTADQLEDLDPAITWTIKSGTPARPRRMWTRAPAWWDLAVVRRPEGVPLARWLAAAPPTSPVTWVRTAVDQGTKATVWVDVAEDRVTLSPAVWTPATAPVVDELVTATDQLVTIYKAFDRWVREARGQMSATFTPAAQDRAVAAFDRATRQWLAGLTDDPDQVRQSWLDATAGPARELVLTHDLGPDPIRTHSDYNPVQCQNITLGRVRKILEAAAPHADTSPAAR